MAEATGRIPALFLAASLAAAGVHAVPVAVLDQDDGLPSSNVLVVDQDAAPP